MTATAGTTPAVERAVIEYGKHRSIVRSRGFECTCGYEYGWEATATGGTRHAMRAALTAAFDVDEVARIDAETSRCSWSIPQEGHPYHEACLHKRERVGGGVSRGACWDMQYARAEALRAALLGADA